MGEPRPKERPCSADSGTPPYRLRRGGPSPRARLPREVKQLDGQRVYVLHVGRRLGFREIAAQLDMSTTTAWRRFWWYQDAIAYPQLRGLPRDHVPPQRSTRECPSGEPPLLDRPARRRLPHPLPSVRCTARRSDGQPCLRWSVRGATVCPFHGGNAPQVRRAAAARVRQAEAVDRGIRDRLRHVPDLRASDVRALVLDHHRRHGRRPSA